MAEFPPSGVPEDSAKHSVVLEDNVLRQTTEGGALITRPRTTRRPARLFTTGFTYVDSSQYESVNALIETKLYGSASMSYVIPSNAPGVEEEIFVKLMEPINWQYEGTGFNRRWSCTISLREDF